MDLGGPCELEPHAGVASPAAELLDRKTSRCPVLRQPRVGVVLIRAFRPGGQAAAAAA
jgi:hypothetical protein